MPDTTPDMRQRALLFTSNAACRWNKIRLSCGAADTFGRYTVNARVQDPVRSMIDLRLMSPKSLTFSILLRLYSDEDVYVLQLTMCSNRDRQ